MQPIIIYQSNKSIGYANPTRYNTLHPQTKEWIFRILLLYVDENTLDDLLGMNKHDIAQSLYATLNHNEEVHYLN